MDHLQKVRDPIRNRVDVPFVSNNFTFNPNPLTFEQFKSIPQNYGYNTHGLVQGVSGRQILNEVTPFLQSWLFFGLLIQIFGPIGVTLSRDEFVRIQEDGELVITTEALPKYLWFWLAIRHHQPRQETEDHAKLADSCLKLASSVTNKLALHEPSSVTREFLRETTFTSSNLEQSAAERVLLSLVVLGDTLCYARDQIIPYSVGPALHWKYPPLGSVLLQKGGWCSAEISSLFNHCRASTLYYLSTWDRVTLKKDHSRCESSSSCQAHQLNPKTYKTQHAAGCPGCEEHGLSSEAISSILIPEKTIIPLVTVNSRRLDSPLEAVAAEISRIEAVPSYVAISHVWSDGKGNPRRNFLPLCQLQRLQNCTNALYPSHRHPIPFWMDTLCVPVGKRFWPVRNRALNRMKSTYKSAEKILVFDTSLEAVDSSVAPEEALIRIRYSPWSSRLWTMQEGRLGLNLYFQFRDKSISFDNQPYQGGATGTLPAVEGILNSLTTPELARSPAALLLVRALAYTDQTLQLRLSYAQKPPQSDPDEEEIRISAIESFQELKLEDALHKSWYPVARKLVGETYEASQSDDDLRSDIHAIIMSPIVSHCSEAWLRSRGYAYGLALNRLSGSDHFTPGLKPSHMFDDTARGLQGRTTSRIEDEPICLCALLGLDNTQVLDIPVPGLRKKRILSSISSKPKLATLCHSIGLDAQAALSKCHDERMKAALQLVDAFPPHIIFWNVPRLKKQGWRWAPSTLLSEDTQIRARISIYAERREEGLLVNFPGWRISLDHGTVQKTSRNNDCVVLTINADIEGDGDDHPFRRSWLRSRLRGSGKQWQKFFKENHDIALIVSEGKGVLVAVRREVDGIVFTILEAAVERFPPTAPVGITTIFSGKGTWVEYPKWCIG